jgi:Ca-activated chloride channel family protein
MIAALALVVVALARPQSATASVRQAGIDVMLLQDGSTSMRVKDMPGDRWQRSMRFLRTFGETMNWRDDRIAMIVFARIAAAQVRLTNDPNTFFFFLDNLSRTPPFRLQEEGSWDTNIELAIDAGLRMFARDEEFRGPSRNAKVFIVISDGEVWSGEAATAVERAREQRIPMHAIGAGTLAGGPMPIPRVVTDVFRNPEGEEEPDPNVPERSVLDRGGLQELAAAGAGQYFELDRDGDRQIANSIIDATRRRAPTIDIAQTAEELYWYPLAAAAAVLGAGLLFVRERTDLWIQAAAAALILAAVNNLLR